MYKKLHTPLIEALPDKLFPTERFLRDVGELALADAALEDTIEFPQLTLVEAPEPDDIVA